MLRKIIRIDEARCNGCGACAAACHEGAIEMVNGMLCYSGGGACGMPVIHLGPVGVNGNVEKHNAMELYKDNFVIYGKRFASKAKELF